MRVGFIGFGNMAQAIVKGFLSADILAPEQITACAAHYDKLQANCGKFGIHPAKTAAETIQESDIVILAVKPYLIETVCTPVKELLQDKMVISLAVNTPYAKLKEILPDTAVISAIPNTPIAVGRGILICEQENSLCEDQKALLVSLFDRIALLVEVDSAHLGIAGTIAGCSPAFAAMFTEALADAGVKYGLTRSTAYELAAKVLEGSGALYFDERKHPGMLKDAVCSPGGTTIKGVCQLEKAGFRSAILQAIDAIEQK